MPAVDVTRLPKHCTALMILWNDNPIGAYSRVMNISRCLMFPWVLAPGSCPRLVYTITANSVEVESGGISRSVNGLFRQP